MFWKTVKSLEYSIQNTGQNRVCESLFEFRHPQWSELEKATEQLVELKTSQNFVIFIQIAVKVIFLFVDPFQDY